MSQDAAFSRVPRFYRITFQNNSTEVADDVTAVMSKTHVTFTPSSLTSTEASRLHPALASRVSGELGLISIDDAVELCGCGESKMLNEMDDECGLVSVEADT